MGCFGAPIADLKNSSPIVCPRVRLTDNRTLSVAFIKSLSLAVHCGLRLLRTNERLLRSLSLRRYPRDPVDYRRSVHPGFRFRSVAVRPLPARQLHKKSEFGSA